MALPVAQTPIRSRSVEESARYLVAGPDDDATSLGARFGESDSRRVILVIPDENRLLDSPVSMRLLLRAASREALSLAIVSGRSSLRRVAAIEGLPALSSLSAVPRSAEPGPDPLPTPLETTLAELSGAVARSYSWLCAIGLVVAIVMVAALALPRATVYVQPVTDRLSGAVRITADADATSPDPAHGTLPSRVVYLEVNSSAALPVESKDHPLDGRAVGFITLENRSSQVVTVPRGTDLSTFSGVHFETTTSVVLDGRPGATAEIPIVASAPGDFANVLRGQIVVVGGPLRWLVTAVNEDQTAGGGPGGEPIVTAWETHRLLAQALASSRQIAQQRLAGVVATDEIAVPESVEVTPIEETFDHAIGAQAKTVSVQVQSRVQAQIVNQRDLDNLAAQIWHPTIRAGYVPVANSVHVGTPTAVQVGQSTATFDVPISAIAAANVNTDRVAAYVRLRSPRDAEQELDRLFDLAAPTRVTISPGWLPRAYRVQVVIDTGATPTTSSAGQQ